MISPAVSIDEEGEERNCGGKLLLVGIADARDIPFVWRAFTITSYEYTSHYLNLYTTHDAHKVMLMGKIHLHVCSLEDLFTPGDIAFLVHRFHCLIFIALTPVLTDNQHNTVHVV